MPPQKQITISWQAPEFKHYEKNLGWYTTLFAVTVLVVGFFVLQSDYFAAVIMLIVAVVTFYFARQHPRMMDIEINHNHIKYGPITFHYKHIKYFWIVNNDNHKTLNLETTTYLNNLIILQLEETDPEMVRIFLLQYLPEHPESVEETFAQKIMHLLKF